MSDELTQEEMRGVAYHRLAKLSGWLRDSGDRKGAERVERHLDRLDRLESGSRSRPKMSRKRAMLARDRTAAMRRIGRLLAETSLLVPDDVPSAYGRATTLSITPKGEHLNTGDARLDIADIEGMTPQQLADRIVAGRRAAAERTAAAKAAEAAAHPGNPYAQEAAAKAAAEIDRWSDASVAAARVRGAQRRDAAFDRLAKGIVGEWRRDGSAVEVSAALSEELCEWLVVGEEVVVNGSRCVITGWGRAYDVAAPEGYDPSRPWDWDGPEWERDYRVYMYVELLDEDDIAAAREVKKSAARARRHPTA